MYPLLETIRFENGVFSNPEYHFRRMKKSVNNCFNQALHFKPEHVLLEAQKNFGKKKGLYKFRLLYDAKQFRWEFTPYQLPSIKTLKLIVDNQIEYSHKFSDRTKLDLLHLQRGDADDILVVKNGKITDTSFANIVFYDGHRWLTPRQPLLPGTQRAFLLDTGQLSETEITPDDMSRFSKARLINAMIRFEDAVEVRVLNP